MELNQYLTKQDINQLSNWLVNPNEWYIGKIETYSYLKRETLILCHSNYDLKLVYSRKLNS